MSAHPADWLVLVCLGALVAFSAIYRNNCLIGGGFRDRGHVIGSFKDHGVRFGYCKVLSTPRLDENNEEISQKYIQSQRQAMRGNVSVNVNVRQSSHVNIAKLLSMRG